MWLLGCLSWCSLLAATPAHLHAHQTLVRNAQTAFTVARTMFETDGLPKHMAEHMAALDEIWVSHERM